MAPGFYEGSPLTVTGLLGIIIALGFQMQLVAVVIMWLITILAVYFRNRGFKVSLADKDGPVIPMTWNIIEWI